MTLPASTLPASIVIPAYNHGPYVEECVASALATDAEVEVIVVDDGSSDDTALRVEGFADDERLRLFRQENRGAHAALNRGVDTARGEIVFLLNSDDAFGPQRVPRFLDRFAREPELGALASWLEVVDAAGARLGIKEAWRNMPPWPRPGPGPGLAGLDDPLLALLEANYVATTSNFAFRRRLWTADGPRFLPLRYAHDWDFFLALGARGGLGLIEEPLVRYRVHPENTLAEGRDGGQGLMRYEILWLLARHAEPLRRRYAAAGYDGADLRRRLRASLPRFGRPEILEQLRFLRGAGERPPVAYDALIDPGHPYRERAVEALGASEDGAA